MTDVVQVHCTAPSEAAAQRLVDALLAERLVACGQVLGPMASRYWWRGELEATTEWLVVLKTTARRAEEVVAALTDLHDDEVPEVLVTAVLGGATAYLEWVAASVR